MEFELIEYTTKDEMLKNYQILHEMYPSLTGEEYDKELDTMIPNKYGQVCVLEQGVCVGISGYWIGTKLWCGKYLECDNVYVDKKYRRRGIANLLFDYLKMKAQNEGCTLLALDSYTDNFEAHKFFYQEGYVPRGFHFINVLDSTKLR